MGRPLNKKYFGNRNIGSTSTTADDGIGGEGLDTITLGGTNNSSGYAVDDALTITAPDLPTGVQATAKVKTVNGSGKILTVEITEKGSGYTAIPTITAATGTQGTLTLTGALTVDTGNVGSATNQENAISITAWVPATGAAGNISGNGTSAVKGDIVRQVGSKKYVVRTAQGLGRVSLVAGTPATGEATIIATDVNSNTYYVTKLTSHKALLTRIAGGSNYVYATGDVAQWSFDAASGTIVQIANA